VINAMGAGGSEPASPDGCDALFLTYDVSTVPGQFEFDTACYSSTLGTIYMIDNGIPVIDHGPSGTGEVVFEKGTITIASCYCGVKGDLNNDGQANPLDMVYMVNLVYRGVNNFVHPEGWSCPVVMGDTDCDGIISPVDVINIGIFIYRGRDVMCDPCTF